MPEFGERKIAESVLNWYDLNHRELPWRISPSDALAGIQPDPYHIWLSEVMLQQTTVQSVTPYFHKFLALWPNVTALAHAPNDDIMAAWAGLGYYSRARNLHKCAKIIASDYGGHFPQTKAALLQLPGIGDYTASAIASIAFGQSETVIDGNIERVTARLGAIDTPLPLGKKEIAALAKHNTPAKRAGDYAQALMDIGSSICTPRNPKCLLCPLSPFCKARDKGIQEALPIKAKKTKKPERIGAAYIIQRPSDGAIWLEKRPDHGLLGGMAQTPTTDWSSNHDGDASINAAPIQADWQDKGSVSHVFTHFRLTLSVYYCTEDNVQRDGWWSREPSQEALPTLFAKALTRALA